MAIGRTNASVGSKIELENKVVDLSMADGNQIITPSSEDKAMSKVVITRPATLIPNNILKDVNIGGVVGTLNTEGPTKGAEFFDYDTDGFPHGIRFKGMTELPLSYITFSNSGFTKKLEYSKIDLSNITTLNYHSITSDLKFEIPSNIKYMKTTDGPAIYCYNPGNLVYLADRNDLFYYSETEKYLKTEIISKVDNFNNSYDNITFEPITNSSSYIAYYKTPSNPHYLLSNLTSNSVANCDIIIHPDTKVIQLDTSDAAGYKSDAFNSFTYIQNPEISSISVSREFLDSFYSKEVNLNFNSENIVLIGKIYTNKIIFGDRIHNINLSYLYNSAIQKLDTSKVLDVYLMSNQIVQSNAEDGYLPFGEYGKSRIIIDNIYVPENLLNDYKTDQKWSIYGDIIKAIPAS